MNNCFFSIIFFNYIKICIAEDYNDIRLKDAMINEIMDDGCDIGCVKLFSTLSLATSENVEARLMLFLSKYRLVNLNEGSFKPAENPVFQATTRWPYTVTEKRYITGAYLAYKALKMVLRNDFEVARYGTPMSARGAFASGIPLAGVKN